MRTIPFPLVVLLLAPLVLPARGAEGRYPIYELPVTIGTPGTYYLTRSVSGIGGITVGASPVTIDLNGFTLGDRFFGGTAVTISTPNANVVIRNGAIISGTPVITYSGDLATGSLTIDHVEIEGGSSGICIQLNDVPTVRVTDSILHDCAPALSISCSGCSSGQASIRGLVARNTFVDGGRALELSGARGFTFRDNEVSAMFGMSLVYITDSSLVRVEGNVLRQGGIDLFRVSDAIVARNAIGGAELSFGIRDNSDCHSNVYVENAIDGAAQDGIEIWGDTNRIEGNTVTNSIGFGLNFRIDAENNYYARNMLSGNLGSSPCDQGGTPAPDLCVGGVGQLSSGDNAVGGTLQ